MWNMQPTGRSLILLSIPWPPFLNLHAFQGRAPTPQPWCTASAKPHSSNWFLLSEVNCFSWKTYADAVWTHILRLMSISSSVGFAFSLGAFCFSPHVHGKSRNLKGLAWCSLHQGAVSHFRLDYGWQVKENKNCLSRRDAEEYHSFSWHISKLGPVKKKKRWDRAKNLLHTCHRQVSFQLKWMDSCIDCHCREFRTRKEQKKKERKPIQPVSPMKVCMLSLKRENYGNEKKLAKCFAYFCQIQGLSYWKSKTILKNLLIATLLVILTF